MTPGLAAILAASTLALTIPAHAADLKYERERMKSILAAVSKDIEQHYYDPTFGGQDWRSLVFRAERRIEDARTASEMVTAIYGLVDSLKNSHTVFLPPPYSARVSFGFEAKAYGDEVRIGTVTEGGRAQKAGLVKGDRLLAVNGYAVTRENLALLLLFFRTLRPVLALDLQVASGAAAPRLLRIEGEVKQGQVRMDFTRIETVYELLREFENQSKTLFYWHNYDDDIGFLGVTSFAVSKDFLDGLVKKIRDNQAFVLDLRGNPGGSLETLAGFAGHFVDEPEEFGSLVGRKKTEPFKIKPRKPRLPGHLAILVDSETASSAEVFARHFQRSGRATVIGDRTSGRASASQFFPGAVGAGSIVFYGLQITTARMVLPGGEDLEGAGVEPDRFCVPTPEDLREDRDPCRGVAFKEARLALGLPARDSK